MRVQTLTLLKVMTSKAGMATYVTNSMRRSPSRISYYLPPFQSCARDSNVGALMCSYCKLFVILGGIPCTNT